MERLIIGAEEFGKELRINIISDDSNEDNSEEFELKFDSKIFTNFLSGDLCLHGVSIYQILRF